MKVLPRYPIYVPSRGRSHVDLTAAFLARDGVPFRLVVEPAERDAYAGRFGAERVLVLPWDNPPGTTDGLVRSRNWIWQHALSEGYARHWQVDDNIREVYRSYGGKRIRCDSGPAFAAVEDFADRYENVGLAGMNYHMFGLPSNPPFFLNAHVYSCTLIDCALPFRFRGSYNEDVDMCLQVLSTGTLCTVLVNVFLAEKMRTMTVRGGQTDAVYCGDGRLKMARALERVWPGVVSTDRRFKRPQHVVRDSWRKFDTPLRRRPDVEVPAGSNEYGLALAAKREIRSPNVRALRDAWEERRRGGDPGGAR